jgi:solute carrier family 45 protein 1/2/4
MLLYSGNLHLANLFPFFGKTQLQVLCVISALLLLLTHIITSLTVKERVLLPDDGGQDAHFQASKHRKRRGLKGFFGGTISVFRDIWQNAHTLPPNIRQICLIQFFSWIGWFPLLFFTTVWVGEIYTLSLPQEAFDNATQGADGEGSSTITEEATLRGFRALLYSALLGLVTIILLPLIVAASHKAASRRGGRANGGINLAELWCFSLLLFSLCMFATLFTSTSVKGATLVVATSGFCFAVSQWVPFSLLAEEIQRGADDANVNGAGGYQPVGNEDNNEEGAGRDPESIPLHQTNSPLVHHGRDDEDRPETAGLVFDAGEISRTGDADERTLVDADERRQQDRDRSRRTDRTDRNDPQRRAEERELMKDLESTEFGLESPFVGGNGPGGSGQGRGRFGEGDDIELQVGGGTGRNAKENIGDKAGIILVSFIRLNLTYQST